MSSEEFFSPQVIVPIIVAFIGFLIAVTTAVIAKEQKISEFRQAWINDFRNNAAELYTLMQQANFYAYLYHESLINGENNSDYLDNYNSISMLALTKFASLKLRLQFNSTNKIESDYIKNAFSLMNIINKYKKKSKSSAIKRLDKDTKRSIDEFTELTQIILKSEWERVKKGEKRFILFVTIGEFFGGAFIIAFFVLFYLVKFPEYFPGINWL